MSNLQMPVDLSAIDLVLKEIIVDLGIHGAREICSEIIKRIGCSSQEAYAFLAHNQEYVQIQEDFWENKKTLVTEVESHILTNDREYRLKKTRAMPEMTQAIDPSTLVGKIPRYATCQLNASCFGAAVALVVKESPRSNLIFVNNKIANFKEAFVKDVYNVILRERRPMEPVDIALRLFDSKVGIYKRTLKQYVPVRKGSTKLKPAHKKISSDEIFFLLSVIEEILQEVIETRPHIFVRLSDRRVNAKRNHIGIIRVKLNEDRIITINMKSESDIANKVTEVIDDNRAYLNKLIRQFGAKIDETEIQSRFFEKIWQSIVQYDDIWGHKFHTFLHRTLKNILLDELNKCDKRVETVSLNSSVNEKSNDELQNVYRDRASEVTEDPSAQVCSLDLINMIRSSFDKTGQAVLFSLMDGMKDKDIAASLNKTVAEILTIKRGFRRNHKLMMWLR